MIPERATSDPQTRRTDVVRAIGLFLVLINAVMHARMGLSALPYWDSDPIQMPPALGPERGIQILDVLTGSLESMGPTGSTMFALLGLTGAMVLLCVTPRGLSRAALVLGAIGTLPVLWYLFHATPDRVRLGTNWLSAVWGGLAIWHLGGDQRWRAIVMGVLTAFLVLIAAKGLTQVTLEHEATVEQFEASRDSILASRGWEPGSPMALAYERRLRQSEATGWFGLSNVCATFMAAGLVACAGIAVRAWRDAAAPKWGRLAVLGVGAACAIGLALTKSKGGIASAGVGLALLGAMEIMRRRPQRFAWVKSARAERWAGFAAVACGAAAIAAVVVRGIIGLRWGELSLLFRWFYIEAATRIFAGQPLKGVGPDGFQAAYARAKNPLSPEEVVSPHSLPFDWLATLGVAALAWIVLAAWWVHRAGPGLLASAGDAPEPGPEPLIDKPRGYLIAGIAMAATVLPQVIAPGGSLAVTIATQASNVDPLPTWALGCGLAGEALIVGLWVLAAIGIARCVRVAPAAASAGAVVLWVHAQIEMTPVQAGSAPLFFALLAALVSPAKPRQGTSNWAVLALGPAIAAMLLGGQRLAKFMHWESILLREARKIEPGAVLLRQRREIEGAAISRQERNARLAELDRQARELLGPNMDGESSEARLEAVRTRSYVAAAAGLEHVASIWGDRDVDGISLEVRRFILAAIVVRDGPAPDAMPESASMVASALAFRGASRAEAGLQENPDEAGLWALLGDAMEISKASEMGSGLAASAREAWLQASELDPNNAGLVDRLLDDAISREAWEEAQRYAERRLAMNERSRLDPTRLLPERDRVWLEGVAEGRIRTPRPGRRGP